MLCHACLTHISAYQNGFLKIIMHQLVKLTDVIL